VQWSYRILLQVEFEESHVAAVDALVDQGGKLLYEVSSLFLIHLFLVLG